MANKNSSKLVADKLFPVRKEDIEVKNIPLEERRLHTETYDFSISTIHDYLKDGVLEIPLFQRGYVWSRSQASRLIESLIIQCPIPVLYLSQTSDEKLLVIDGNQRLNSIKFYLEDAFPLTGLTAYPELEGYKFSELDPRFQRHIMNRTLRCITILKETHPQIKFDVFERLNTGAVLLSPQEIRHGIYYGKLMVAIDKLADDDLFKRLVGIRDNKRMKGENLILRFLSLYENYEDYKFPLLDFMNRFAEKNRNPNPAVLKRYSAVFKNTLSVIDHILGDNAFQMLVNTKTIFAPIQNAVREVEIVSIPSVKFSKKTTGLINNAVFDAQMVAVAKLDPEEGKVSKVDKKAVLDDVLSLMRDETFYKCVTASTSNENAVKYRITAMTDVLAKHLV